MSGEQLERLARYFDEEVIAAPKYKRAARALPSEGIAFRVEVAGGLKR